MFDEFTHIRVSLDSPGWYVSVLGVFVWMSVLTVVVCPSRADKIALGFRYPPYKVWW